MNPKRLIARRISAATAAVTEALGGSTQLICYLPHVSMSSAGTSNGPMESSGERLEDAFHRLLGQLVHTIARLDFSVGLQLRFWGMEDDPRIQSLLKPRTAQLNDRLMALERLLKIAWADVGQEGLEAMADWFNRAHRARGFRNEYAHGRWGLPGKFLQAESGRHCDATPLLLFIPLDWNMSPDRPDETISLTLEEFADQVEEAKNLAAEYWKITKKYGGQAYTGHRLS